MNNKKTKETKGKLSMNFIKQISSLKLTVFCLLFLILIVLWGTVYQVDNGLYQAQERFFYSWYFLAFGFIPLPGAVLISFVLTLNLVASVFYRIGFKISNIGNLITHIGLIVLLVGSGITLFFAVESSLVLKEGETKNISSARNLWELAFWEETDGDRRVYAFDTDGIKVGKLFKIDKINIEVKRYFKNCSPVFFKSKEKNNTLNSSGIKSLKKLPEDAKMQNLAGIVFNLDSGDESYKLLLFGADRFPTKVKFNDGIYNFVLRKKTYLLPITVMLKDFIMKKYPNSNIVKSYESIVRISNDKGMERDVKISMNKPLRYENYTFFQSSYSINPDGTEYSIFSVVKNSGRLLPYFSSLIIFLGLIIHFIMMFYRRRKKKQTVN